MRPAPTKTQVKNLPPKVIRCQGKCGKDITNEEGHKLVVKSAGTSSYIKNGKEVSTHGPLYIHFQSSYLKKFNQNTYYTPQEDFDWKRVNVQESTYRDLADLADIAFVVNLGVPRKL